MVRVEFHCHTCFSKDSLTSPERLIQTYQQRGIDRVVITDHNTIAGARYAQHLDPQRVIIGEEIMTDSGEILAAFLTEEIPPNLTPSETIHRLREQGAFISVSHPFDQLRSGHWQLADLEQIAPLVDAIETFNARCMLPSSNQRALIFAQQHHLAGTVGSDAHATFELGQATLFMNNFNNTEELKDSLRTSQPQVTLSPPWVHFASRYARWQKKITKLFK